MAEGGFRRSEQKAGKRASGSVEVDSVAGRIAAEAETTSAILAFVVILIGATYLKAKIDRVAAMRQKPVIVKAQAELAIDGEGLAVVRWTERSRVDRISGEGNTREDGCVRG